MKHVIRREDLEPRGPTSYAFEGYKHGSTCVSLHLTDLPPGEGPRLHRHPYEEVFVIHEGQAIYTLGDMQLWSPLGRSSWRQLVCHTNSSIRAKDHYDKPAFIPAHT